ncbi:hypothetical protein JY651_46465 [Pyxidicoccus parkwayensis]|uniref:Lipoprotein n=1 Tax=Pyxidicoccus parkwayensis TaxID=2813578 RepID=A0ABX7NUC9_9BACT|nr:hypothetical protein [Pyxidicoccus parkwaysis]QSQ22484.1 hypothetical protein JY651_46465 [Pyxidicoccus parkwaysis]
MVKARGAVFLGLVLTSLGAAEAGDARKDYLHSLELYEQGLGFSLEHVFDSGLVAARALRDAPPDAPASLPGFIVGGDDARDFRPDPRFFLDLAKRRGTGVDREFFSLLGRTYARDGVTRLYHSPTGCDAFDHPELEPLYRDWTRFWATTPRAYTVTVEREVAALEDLYSQGTCACGDSDSVQAGLERFLKSFPRSPVAPRVRARLDQVRAGTSDFRFRCQQG